MNLIFTSCTFAYLDKARVLAKTVKEHCADWEFALVMIDEEPEGFSFDLAQEDFDKIYRIADMGLENYHSWMFGHDVVELCTAVKGPFLKKFVENGYKKIIYLDPDIAVFSSLEPISELLDTYSIVLTPHQVTPEEETIAIIDNEIAALNYGVYNLGFLAIRNDLNGQRLANWWNDRLLEYCHDDLPRGLFVDQKWFDLVPAMFDNVHILRDPGYNVASWNLSHRTLTISNERIYVNNIYPLRFYHFTKLGPVGYKMTTRYARDNHEVIEIWNEYQRMVERNAAINLPNRWWFYGTYSDGTPINKPERVRYRHDKELQKRFPNPFIEKVEFRKAINYIEDAVVTPKVKKQNFLLRFLEKNTRTPRRFLEKNTRSLRRFLEKNTRTPRRFLEKNTRSIRRIFTK